MTRRINFWNDHSRLKTIRERNALAVYGITLRVYRIFFFLARYNATTYQESLFPFVAKIAKRIDRATRAPNAKENGMSGEREIVVAKIVFQCLTKRDPLPSKIPHARMHQESCTMCHCENDKRENFGAIYRRAGKWAKAARKYPAADVRERKALHHKSDALLCIA